ncbi:hypothetical protein [Wenzhouxiangella sp. EGI_FJ10305]|uniref:hypothetical protein n=1 Tax=Wenzhouxiangella sp. EGI_FJ10305 TaxID=3243768 RepID=UPI0035D803EF
MKILNPNDPIAHAIEKTEDRAKAEEWIESAESLGRKWSKLAPEEISFKSTDEILKASYLLDKGRLPEAAWSAYSHVVLDAILEIEEKKLTVDSLHIKPPKRGRQEDRRQKGYMILKTQELIRFGYSPTEAYDQLAQELHKSPDTVRRTYERARKKSKP